MGRVETNGNEPWTLRQGEHKRHDENREDDLEGNGNTPGSASGCEVEAEVDPLQMPPAKVTGHPSAPTRVVRSAVEMLT